MASKAEVRYNPEVTDPAKIADCVKELGFTASVMENYEGSDGHLEVVVSHCEAALTYSSFKTTSTCFSLRLHFIQSVDGVHPRTVFLLFPASSSACLLLFTFSRSGE